MPAPVIRTVSEPVTRAVPRRTGASGAVEAKRQEAAALPGSGGNAPPVQDSIEALHAAAAAIERHVREAGRQLSFHVDDQTGRMVVTVTDTSSGEVIRQVPSEEALRIAHNLEGAQQALVSEVA